MRIDEFSRLVQTKDPEIIKKFGDFRKLCPQGLCIITGDEIVKGNLKTI